MEVEVEVAMGTVDTTRLCGDVFSRSEPRYAMDGGRAGEKCDSGCGSATRRGVGGF